MSDLPGQTTGTGAPPGYESGQQQPQQPVVQPGTYPSGPRAGFWRRFVALVLDGFVIAIPAIVLFLVFDAAIAYVLTLVGYAAYYIVLQGGPTGQTIGKKVLDIRVVDINTGGPIGNGRSAVRFLVQFFLSGILYLGYLWMLWDKEKQTWHDKASTSVVVPTSAYPIP
jgi:uncharacterized RDD family membrane protein YckC